MLWAVRIVVVWMLFAAIGLAGSVQMPSAIAQAPVAQTHADSVVADAAKPACSIKRIDPALDQIIDSAAAIETVSAGHAFTEGPAWNRKTGEIYFCDIPRNEINRIDSETGELRQFLHPSGYDGPKIDGGKEPGTNGLIFGQDGKLIACDQGMRRLYRLEDDGTKTTLVDRYEGKRFNSPNDLVMDRDGNIFFTDPPYGMVDESHREIQWHGVYRLATDGSVMLLTKEFSRPNGIALSPDQKTLYVAQSDPDRPIVGAFDVNSDGSVSGNRTLFDAKPFTADLGLPDGMTVDASGNLWVTGPGGVLILSSNGKLLGRILTGLKTNNCAFGGEDGSVLYITCKEEVLRVQTKVTGW